MHEQLQPPSLERAPAQAPKRGKFSRVDMPQVTPEQIQLFAAKDSLDKEIAHLQDLSELASDEQRAGFAEEIKELEANRAEVLQSLGQARPEEFGLEAAFEKAIKDKSPAEKRKAIEAQENAKNDLEETSDKLKGNLRLMNAELKEVLGKNPKRSGELEGKIRETQAQFDQTEQKRLEAWKNLADLDPKFKDQAELEASLAQDQRKKFEQATDEDIDSALDMLRANIDKS